jgi:hypothetical protein
LTGWGSEWLLMRRAKGRYAVSRKGQMVKGMRFQRLSGILVAVLLVAACGGSGQEGSTRKTPSVTPSSGAQRAAWEQCQATQVPPSSVLNASPQAPTKLEIGNGVSEDQARQVVQAWVRTSAILDWAISQNQLGFLSSGCIASKTGGAEDEDLQIVRTAQSLGGHAVFDPPAVLVAIGVKMVSQQNLDEAVSKTGARPTYALITVRQQSGLAVLDGQGKLVKRLVSPSPGARVEYVLFIQVRNDGIGLRVWQVVDHFCDEPEVSGVCAGVG